MSEKNTIIIRPKVNRDEKKYTIYNYLKEHHTLLIASISGFITALSFVISMIAYLYQIILFRKWNIPLDSIENLIQNRFIYYFAVSIALTAFTIWSQEKIKDQWKLYYRYSAEMKYLRCEIECLQKNNKSIEKEQRAHFKRIKIAFSEPSEMTLDNKQIYQSAEENNTKIKANKYMAKKLKRCIAKYLFRLNMYLGILSIVYSIIILPLWFIVSSFSGEINYVMILLVWIGFCLISFISARVEVNLFFEPYTPIRIKRIVKTMHKESKSTLGFLNTMHEYFDELQTKNDNHSVLSNDNIKRLLSSIFISMLFYLFR